MPANVSNAASSGPLSDGWVISPEAAAASRPIDEDCRRGAGMLVLIVEDQPADAVMIARTLSRAGHKSHRANDVSEAINLIGQHEFDAVITDLSLPGKSGHD